jgi:hypothetical protein
MQFKIITFKELLEKKFNVPSYQRGYRWEKENVEALLNDIQEFADKKDKEENEFYCLQPIVVKKNSKLSTEEGDVYDLLDGQQRLTTLWLILNALKFKTIWDALDSKHPKVYSIQYESRKNLLQKATELSDNYLENIDLFYLKKAFDTISNWEGEPYKVLNTLVPNNPNRDLHNVRIIWYEFGEEKKGDDDKQSDSIKVFSRLNYGKISLTDTELIKALILQSDLYPNDNSSPNSKNIMKERLFRIATEWDDIEKGLHNEQLWGMLAPSNYNPANHHIELLLKFVAAQIQVENEYDIIDFQRRDFHIISKYLGLNANIPPAEYAQKIDDLWTKIKDAYNAIRNWYTNDDFYHLIGLYALLRNNTDTTSLVEQIYRQYTSQENDKTIFQSYLKREIGKLIQIKEKANGLPLELHELVYGVNNTRMIRILEALNIYLYLTNKSINSRFNFRKFKDFNVTSLEHIHPQHLSFEDDVKYEDAKEWYTNAKRIFLLDTQCDKELSEAIATLEEKLSSQKEFENAKSICQEAIEKMDQFFDAKAGIDDGHMHTLYNIALVDKDTNAALSNNLIDIKRSILQEREIENKTYIPLATNYVFNKHFSKTVSDMKFWTKDDREAYFEVIKKAYEYFTKEI